MSNKTFTPEQVAAISGKALTTVMTWIRAKKLKAKRTRSYSIDGGELREFLLKEATEGKVGRRRTAKS
jgi:hypothetical protein